MSKLLKGKVAVITGAASGIGLATTKAMIEAGVKVFMVDWDEKTVKEKAQYQTQDKLKETIGEALNDQMDKKDRLRRNSLRFLRVVKGSTGS